MARKILIYSHDTYGLGNIRRNHALATHLVETQGDARILLLTSSRWFHMFPSHPRIEFVKLPELVRVERGGYRSRSAGVELDPLVRVRREILLGATRGFRPDLFLVDKIPRGVGGELTPTLETVGDDIPQKVLVLRDVLDEPDWTRDSWAAGDQYGALARFFDAAWVFGDPSVYATDQKYGLDRVSGLDVHYCGYISRRDELGTGLPEGDESPFLVTVGGGEDGQQVLGSVAEALESLGGEAPPVEVVLGPYMPSGERKCYQDRFAALPRSRCLTYVRNVPTRIRRARGVVSMGGYNTVCEILSNQTPALVIPRTIPAREQLIRAERMSELGYFRTAIPGSDSANAIVSKIRDFFSSPGPRHFPRPTLDGLTSAGRLATTAT